MVDCASGDSYCSFTIVFGVISIILLILVVIFTKAVEILILHYNQHIIILFVAHTLCIIMIIQYFVTTKSRLLYFIKEYFLLITYTITSYYFIFQAFFLLQESKLLKLVVWFSGIASVLTFTVVAIMFGFNLIMQKYSIPCNHDIYIIMRSLGLMMSTIFCFTGILISRKLKLISRELNQEEVRFRIIYLW